MEKSKVRIMVQLLPLLTLGLLVVFVVLSAVIYIGDQKVAAGKQALEQGNQELASGKTRLANGEHTLNRVKKTYSKVKTGSLVWVATAVPVAGEIVALAGNKFVNNRIANGEQQVSTGKEKVKAGEAQLSAGAQELAHGIKELGWMNMLRIACGIGAVIFAILSIVMGSDWKHILNRK